MTPKRTAFAVAPSVTRGPTPKSGPRVNDSLLRSVREIGDHVT